MVEPPGLHTASFSTPGWLPLSNTMRALPKRVWAAYSWALARGNPAATPPSANASINWYTHAGPQPETQQAASIKFSGMASSRPAGAMAPKKANIWSSLTPSAQYWIIPAPSETGVLGMMRMIGYAPPAISRTRAMLSPAAIVTRTKRPLRFARMGAMPASISAIICGFTPRKITSQSCATTSLVAARQPSASARASALAGVRLASATFSGPTPRHTARATAPPMLPQPIKP